MSIKMKVLTIIVLAVSQYFLLVGIRTINEGSVLSWMLNIGYFLLYEGILLKNNRR